MSEKGYCVHGVYVGGCGIDWMCQLCEDGVSYKEWQEMLKYEEKARKRKERQRKFLDILLYVYLHNPIFGKKWLIKKIAKLVVATK